MKIPKEYLGWEVIDQLIESVSSFVNPLIELSEEEIEDHINESISFNVGL
jgi:hypothetical protein